MNKKKTKKKVIKKEKEIEEEKNKKEAEKNNKILRNILIIIGLGVLIFVGIYFGMSYKKTFEYAGFKWDIIETNEVTFYHTTFPVYSNRTHVANHNVYFRNDPRELEKENIFEGELDLTEMLVIQGLKDFQCDGYGATSQDAFEQVLNALGTQTMQDPEAECDELGRYNLVKLFEGSETKVISESPTCHKFLISNCELYKVKEAYLLKGLSQKNFV